MKSLRTPFSGSIIATTVAVALVAGCSQRQPPIDGAGPMPIANPTGSGGDILERDQMTIRARTMEELLTTRLSGIVIRRSRGNAWIELRGPGSITGSTEALIVIDGIQNSSRGLLSMNPEQIQRIQLLKGASASAFGVRGGNGVVLVTTRRYGQH